MGTFDHFSAWLFSKCWHQQAKRPHQQPLPGGSTAQGCCQLCGAGNGPTIHLRSPQLPQVHHRQSSPQLHSATFCQWEHGRDKTPKPSSITAQLLVQLATSIILRMALVAQSRAWCTLYYNTACKKREGLNCINIALDSHDFLYQHLWVIYEFIYLQGQPFLHSVAMVPLTPVSY